MNPAQPETPSPGFAALVGLDWGHGAHAIALQAGGATAPETSTLEHSAEHLHQWLDQIEQRLGVAGPSPSPSSPAKARRFTR